MIFVKKTFRGGVHPEDKKKLSADKPIEKMPLSKEYVVPLSQHVGSPAEPLVKKGDIVLKGQKIADKDGYMTSAIHSPTSGEVIDVKKMMHPFGQKVLSVIIKPDNLDKWADLKTNKLEDLSGQQIVEIVREAGIVGLGGAAFLTHVKLSPPKDKKIDTLIINGVECEPYLTADYRLMLEEGERIIIGIKAILKALNLNKAILAIESNKPKAIQEMGKALKADDSIKIVVLETKYPQGSEKQLIEAITKRQVPVGKLPADVGVIVQNVGTAKAIADAIIDGKPLIERVITVSGSNIKKPSNLIVRIGTKISDIIDYCGSTFEKIEKVILGGPMMGIAAPSIDVPIIKGTSGIILLKKNEIVLYNSDPCIRCGKCIQVCPMGLAPARLMDSSESKDFDDCMAENILNCMECGSCAFVCPSRRPLVHWIKVAKSNIQKKLKK